MATNMRRLSLASNHAYHVRQKGMQFTVTVTCIGFAVLISMFCHLKMSIQYIFTQMEAGAGL